jgi:hypothetical protein
MLTGLDIEEKARRGLEAAFWAACPYGPDDFASVRTRLVERTDHADPGSNEAATAAWRRDRSRTPTKRKVGRAFSQRVHRDRAGEHPRLLRPLRRAVRGGRRYGVYRPALVDAADLVPSQVTVHVGGTHECRSTRSRRRPRRPDRATPGGRHTVAASSGQRSIDGSGTARSGVGARSGDKGGDANLGVFARTDAAFEWSCAGLPDSVERLRELLPEAAGADRRSVRARRTCARSTSCCAGCSRRAWRRRAVNDGAGEEPRRMAARPRGRHPRRPARRPGPRHPAVGGVRRRWARCASGGWARAGTAWTGAGRW